MTASLRDITEWVKVAQEKGATHLIVACDTYDHDNYPVFVMPGENVQEKVDHYSGHNMQVVDEVYSFTGKYKVEDQLREHRVRHLD